MPDNLKRRYEEDEHQNDIVPITPIYEIYDENQPKTSARFADLRFFVRLFVFTLSTIFSGLFLLALGLNTYVALPLALILGLVLSLFIQYTVHILRS